MTSSAVRPAGHPLRELCESLLSRLEELSVGVTDDIRREIPSYVAMPLAEQRDTVRSRLRALLRGLALDVEPTAEQLLEIRAESLRRAYYGLLVQDALATFHVGARRLWDELRATARGTAAEDTAIELVAPLWVWVQSASGVVADAYADEAGARYGREAGLRPLVTETVDWISAALREGGRDPEMGEQLAEVLRLSGLPDPRVAVAAPAGGPDSAAVTLIAESARSLLPVMERGGIATAREVDIDTLRERMARACEEERATVYVPKLVAAWAQVP
ncbi:hypothetical protein ACWD5F_03300 [Streptomyces sp. NPDC002499]